MTIIENRPSADESANRTAWSTVHSRSAALREVVRQLDHGRPLQIGRAHV